MRTLAVAQVTDRAGDGQWTPTRVPGPSGNQSPPDQGVSYLVPKFLPGRGESTQERQGMSVAEPPPQLQLDPPDVNRLQLETQGTSVRDAHQDPDVVAWDEQDNLAQIFRHSGWRNDRRRVYRALIDTHQTVARILNFASCGYGSYVLKSHDEPPRYRIAGSKCKDRFCVPCGVERSRTIAANVIDRLGPQPVRAMTLTIGGVHLPLRERLNHLDKSFAALRRTAFWRKYVTGGVAFLEIKWSVATDRWHPHLHILIEGKYIPKRELSIQWHHVTGDSFIVRLSLVNNREAAVRETTKYASKPINNTYLRLPDRLNEAVEALFGRRMCTTFGRWRGVALTPHPNEDAWEHLGSLHDMVQQAAAGHVDAINVLLKLSETAASTAICIARERSPPDLVYRPPVPDQMTLPGTDPRHFDYPGW